MSGDNTPALRIMTLGRSFEVGMLYDFRTDTLVPNMLLWNKKLISKYLSSQSSLFDSFTYHTSNTFKEKADLLGIDDNLKLSVLAGLVNLSGSATLLDNRQTIHQKEQFILQYSITTHFHQLERRDFTKSNIKHQEIFDQQIGTHVVTGIAYGIEIFLIFNQILSNNESRKEVHHSIKKLLKKAKTFPINDNGELDLNDDEKKLSETLTCQYYGDLQLESYPTSFKDAVKLLKQLPNLLGKDYENTIQKQILIYPLYLLDEFIHQTKRFHQINHNILSRSVQLISDLHQLETTLSDMKTSLSSPKIFYQTEQQLSRLCIRVSEIELDIRRQMMDVLPKIRGQSMEEAVLTNLLKNLEWSLSTKEKLNNWIQFISEGINLFTVFVYDVRKQKNFHFLTTSFSEVQKNFNCEFILRLIIHITEKNDPFLNELFSYPNDSIKQKNDQNTETDWWYNQTNLALIQEQCTLFIQFAKENINEKNVQFVVDEQYTNDFEKKKGVTIILYQNCIPIDFKIPSRPGQPSATDSSSSDTKLSWTKPAYGSENIRQYRIYGRSDLNPQWELIFTTTDDAQSAVLPNFIKGKYQFKIQGITLTGYTVKSSASSIIYIKEAQSAVPTVRVSVTTPPPVVTPGKSTANNVILDVTPAWFEPVKPVTPDNIRLPTNYDEDSSADVRTYKCLSTYRSMMKKTKRIDFVAEPFTSDIENPETLIVVLNELAHHLGARLTFTHADFKYNDSDYRTACGVTNLGSIHSFLASEGSIETAKFNLHLALDYNQITMSIETLKNFILTSINDISTIAQCNKDFIRVFSVSRVQSILVTVGITTPQLDETRKVADLVKVTLNDVSTTKRRGIFRHLIKEDYHYKLEPALGFLQLQESDFEPRYNRAYPNAVEEKRGNYPYHFPQGWYRHALKVVDKYPDDKVWLRMHNSPGEWAVAYHGTTSDGVRGIVDNGLLHDRVTRDAYKKEAKLQNPSIPDVKGLYVATHCEGGASKYAQVFTVRDCTNKSKHYQVVFQCRVQPGKFTMHQNLVNVAEIWRVFDERAIRPYGLLLKSS